MSANGEVPESGRASLKPKPCGRQFESIVLEDTPNVISLGKLVVEEGYSFRWSHGKPPCLKSPERTVFVLDVVDTVPYIDVSKIQSIDIEGKTGSGATSTVKKDRLYLQARIQKKPVLLAQARVPWKTFHRQKTDLSQVREAKVLNLRNKSSERWRNLPLSLNDALAKNPHCKWC